MLAPIALAVAGLLAIVMFTQTSDTRWAVGGVLLLASAATCWFRSRAKALVPVTIILALLGVALMAIAFLRPAVS